VKKRTAEPGGTAQKLKHQHPERKNYGRGGAENAPEKEGQDRVVTEELPRRS